MKHGKCLFVLLSMLRMPKNSQIVQIIIGQNKFRLFSDLKDI